MIKIIACLTMLIDHIGMIFFPNILIFRCIGRVSMPLFAYSIARGYFYSKKNLSIRKYVKNLFLFTIVSQIPYSFMNNGMNIGATWLISVILLYLLENKKSVVNIFIIMTFIIVLIYILKFDYGIYGVLMPIVMYKLMICNRNPYIAFVLMIILWSIYVIINRGSSGSLIQVLSFISIFLITLIDKYDYKIRLSKWIFYSFYPIHILVLIGLRTII